MDDAAILEALLAERRRPMVGWNPTPSAGAATYWHRAFTEQEMARFRRMEVQAHGWEVTQERRQGWPLRAVA